MRTGNKNRTQIARSFHLMGVSGGQVNQLPVGVGCGPQTDPVSTSNLRCVTTAGALYIRSQFGAKLLHHLVLAIAGISCSLCSQSWPGICGILSGTTIQRDK